MLRVATVPNMTWIQPPGYVHSMIADTWQPNGVATSARVPYNDPNLTIGASAQVGLGCIVALYYPSFTSHHIR